MGPVITIPYKKHYTDQDEKRHLVTEYIQLLPDHLDIKGNLVPEIRYRGIYKSVLYSSEIILEYSFPTPKVEDLQIPPEDVLWSRASIGIGITDMRGIRDRIMASQDGATIQMTPGQETTSLFSSGVKAELNLDPDKPLHRFLFLLST